MFDMTYIVLVLPFVFLALIAQGKVQSTFKKYSKIGSRSGITGAQAAEAILRKENIYDVKIEHTSGNLTDHYDPRTKVLRLSDSTYSNSSIAAIGVAAHEAGHAVQHERGYVPISLRNAILPVANFGGTLSWPLIILGIFLSYSGGEIGYVLVQVGIVLFSAVVLFQIVTLPVEFNASSRALLLVEDTGLLNQDESSKAKKVLNAAAMTYVAAAAVSIANLVRLLVVFGNRRD